MALTPAELLRQQALNLDYDDVKELLSSAGLKGEALEALALDWTQKQTNINDIAGSTTTLEGQVEQNTLDIGTNAQNLTDHIDDTDDAHDASAIFFDNTASGLVATDAQGAIDEVNSDLTSHVNSDSAHGSTGDIVGNNDFASSLVGGVVLLAVNVTDVSVTTTVIATADIGAAPAAYSQSYAQEQTDLINECKAKINSLVNSDVLDLITQLNAFLAANQTAKQMAP